MYAISIFDEINMTIDWAMIYYGISKNILSSNIVQEFIHRKLDNDEPLSDEEIELSWSSDSSLEVLELIEKILDNQGNVEENIDKGKAKIRIAIIIYLRKTERDIICLLEQIDMIYENFDYPEDMEGFISYMPVSDGFDSCSHTIEENRNHLVTKLDSFIEEQKEKYQLR